MTKIMKAGQEITSKSVNANIILNEQTRQANEQTRQANEQTRQANELLRQQRIAQVEEDLQAGVGAFTEDTEIINARRDKSGTIHENLKARLDAEKLISEQSAVSLSNQLADVAEQLSATNQPIVDTGNYFSADNTNAALQELGAHKASTENPHGVTKTQVGLGNVDNTSDANKPVSTAVQTALNLKANKVQEAWITPTLLNGWVNFDSGYASCQYRIDSLGTVHLKGMIKNGTLGTPCFTLALGYRPIESQYHLSLSSDTARTLTITSSGDVRISSVASKSWVSFNGITFKI